MVGEAAGELDLAHGERLPGVLEDFLRTDSRLHSQFVPASLLRWNAIMGHGLRNSASCCHFHGLETHI